MDGKKILAVAAIGLAVISFFAGPALVLVAVAVILLGVHALI